MKSYTPHSYSSLFWGSPGRVLGVLIGWNAGFSWEQGSTVHPPRAAKRGLETSALTAQWGKLRLHWEAPSLEGTQVLLT